MLTAFMSILISAIADKHAMKKIIEVKLYGKNMLLK